MSWANGPLLGLDLETTGADPETARVVQWALVAIGHGQQVARRQHGLVNPGVPIPDEARAVHGISDAAVRERGTNPRPTLEMIDRELADASWQVVPVVAYNGVYDLTVLTRECDRHGARRAARAAGSRLCLIDPYVLDRGADRYRKGKRTLTDLARHYDVEQRGAHDALADVETTLALLPAIVERHPWLAHMSLDELQDFQAATMREWAASLTRYFARQGNPRHVEGAWPLIPACTDSLGAAL